MSTVQSTESIVKQLCAGALTGGVIGVLTANRRYFLSSVAFTSVGFLDAAFHWKHLKAHITHLTYNTSVDKQTIKSHINQISRAVQRELRDPNQDVDQEIRWLINDLRRYIDEHIFFGMGFTMTFFLGCAFASPR